MTDPYPRPDTELVEHNGYQIRFSPSGLEWLAFAALPKQRPTLILAPGRDAALAKAYEWIDRQPASEKHPQVTYRLIQLAPGAYDLLLHGEVVGSAVRSGSRQPYTRTAELLEDLPRSRGLRRSGRSSPPSRPSIFDAVIMTLWRVARARRFLDRRSPF
ncbi:hypothetical protein [Microvirga sp. M2]|uniref:hypothetical protein n=1 Tax=Microvirga sp. M2 TaxID=3073270 RepID=UPI0039C19444